MKTILKFLTFLLLVLSSGTTFNNLNAQTTTVLPCPTVGACTAYIMMNGIQGTNYSDWSNTVTAYGKAYRVAHNPPLDPNLIVFDSIFNHGGTVWTNGLPDLAQSGLQRALLLHHDVDLTDPDFVELLDAIEAYSSKRYKVVDSHR